ncbi:MAG: hypothetical protein AB7D01_02305 [Methanoculleus sp.]
MERQERHYALYGEPAPAVRGARMMAVGDTYETNKVLAYVIIGGIVVGMALPALLNWWHHLK